MNWLWHVITDFFTDFFGSWAASAFKDALKERARDTIKMDPETKERDFPEQAKTSDHRRQWALLTNRLDDGKEKALEEYFLSKIGPNQRADFVIHMAKMAKGNTDEERQNNENAALQHLERIARKAGDQPEDLQAMIRIAVSNEFMREHEEDYPIGWLKRTTIGLTGGAPSGDSIRRTIIGDLADTRQKWQDFANEVTTDVGGERAGHRGGAR